METSPTPPNFNLGYTAGTTDIGSGYAAGIAQAGKSFSDATKGVMDVMVRNRTADDTLTAMQQTGMLNKDQFDAISGKSVGAKEQLLGMYAGQWIAQQAQNRELQKLGYQGNVDINVSHAKLLDQISANRIPATPQRQPPPQPKPAPAQQVNTPVQQPSASSISGAPTPWAQPGGAGAALSQFTVGAPYTAKDPVPQGGVKATLRDPTSGKVINGFTTVDANGHKIFRALPGQ